MSREQYDRDVALARAGNREAIERLAVAARPRGGRPRVLAPGDLARAHELRRRGMGWKLIAGELGVSLATLNRAREREAGI